MKREKSLTYAIRRAKRNIDKYGITEAILDAAYEYYLRPEDEIPELVKSVNKFAEKNLYRTVELETILRNF